MWAVHSVSFQRGEYGKEERERKATAEKPDKPHLTR